MNKCSEIVSEPQILLGWNYKLHSSISQNSAAKSVVDNLKFTATIVASIIKWSPAGDGVHLIR